MTEGAVHNFTGTSPIKMVLAAHSYADRHRESRIIALSSLVFLDEIPTSLRQHLTSKTESVPARHNVLLRLALQSGDAPNVYPAP